MSDGLKRPLILLVWLSVQWPLWIKGQAEQQDSLRLEEIASGREQIRLTPEFRKLIESGTLIESAIPDVPAQLYELPFQLEKDFSEYIRMDSAGIHIDIRSLPPAVLMRYGLDPYEEETIPGSFVLNPSDVEEMKQLYGQAYRFSMEDILRTVFWKSHRAKMRNKKKANAWKHYNNY